MNNIPITCINCGAELPENEYQMHMESVHPQGQITAIKQAKSIQENIPNQNLPPGVTPSDLPDPTFIETMKEIEKAQREAQKPKPQEPQQASPPVHPVAELKPIELTYVYTGNCEKGHSVATLETDVEYKHFAIAYCLTCHRQEKIREVEDLKKMKAWLADAKTGEILREIEIPIKKGAKRGPKPNVSGKTAVQSAVQPVSEAN